MSARKLTNRDDKRPMHYQWGYGHRPSSAWGDGDLLAPYAEGDIVDIPANSPAFDGKRIPHGWSEHPELNKPGLYRITTAFSIGEGDEWYFRVAPIIEGDTVWEESSGRMHMIPNVCNFMEGAHLVETGDPENVREWPLGEQG